jgi:hypothetical protein
MIVRDFVFSLVVNIFSGDGAKAGGGKLRPYRTATTDANSTADCD